MTHENKAEHPINNLDGIGKYIRSPAIPAVWENVNVPKLNITDRTINNSAGIVNTSLFSNNVRRPWLVLVSDHTKASRMIFPVIWNIVSKFNSIFLYVFK